MESLLSWPTPPKHLVKGGAEGLLIASNTGHKVFNAVSASVRAPLLHIADATADVLLADGRSRVALLGTRFTMTEPHIRSRLESRSIGLVEIDQRWITEVDRIIFEELAAGKVVRDSQRKLKTLIADLRSPEGAGCRARLHRAGACRRHEGERHPRLR